MNLVLIGLGLTALVGSNYVATRMCGLRIGRFVLMGTSLPAVAVILFTGFRLVYAIINADEVNRRFQHGDLTYFGAGIAFGGSLLLGGLWVLLASMGFLWGRDRSPS